MWSRYASSFDGRRGRGVYRGIPGARRYFRTVLRERLSSRAIARMECCWPASSQSCFTVGPPSIGTSQGVMPQETPRRPRGGSLFDRRYWVTFPPAMTIVTDCRAAQRESTPAAAVRELAERAVAQPADVERALR